LHWLSASGKEPLNLMRMKMGLRNLPLAVELWYRPRVERHPIVTYAAHCCFRDDCRSSTNKTRKPLKNCSALHTLLFVALYSVLFVKLGPQGIALEKANT